MVLENLVDYVAPGNKSLEITVGPAWLSTDFVTPPIPGPQVDLSKTVAWTMCSAFHRRGPSDRTRPRRDGANDLVPGGASRLNQSLCVRHVHRIGLGILGAILAIWVGFMAIGWIFVMLKTFSSSG
jgi:hypothetical protein